MKVVTEQYQNMDSNVTQRKEMLSQFMERVSDYERQVKEFTQWLTDCCKRVDELPVADISTDGLLSQLNNVQVAIYIAICDLLIKDDHHWRVFTVHYILLTAF